MNDLKVFESIYKYFFKVFVFVFVLKLCSDTYLKHFLKRVSMSTGILVKNIIYEDLRERIRIEKIKLKNHEQ